MKEAFSNPARPFYRYGFLWVLFLLLAFAAQKGLVVNEYNSDDVIDFERIMHQKEKEVLSLMEVLEETIVNYNTACITDEWCTYLNDLFYSDGYAILAYEYDNLVYWSNNSVPLGENLSNEMLEMQDFLYLENAWYVVKHKKVGEYELFGLILIVNQYPYQNKFLQNDFQEDFSNFNNVAISPNETKKTYAIYSYDGEFLFSLNFENAHKINAFWYYLSVILYILSGFFFLKFIRTILFRLPGKYFMPAYILVALLLSLLKYVSGILKAPAIIYEIALFSPAYYATSVILPSLGDLLLWSIIIFYLAEVFSSGYRTQITAGKGYLIVLFRSFIFLIIMATFLGANAIFENLIYNSSINFQTYRALDLTIYSFIGLTIVGLFYSSFLLLVRRFVRLLPVQEAHKRYGLTHFAVQTTSLYIMFYILGWQNSFIPLVALLLFYTIVTYFRFGLLPFRYSIYTIIIFFFSIYAVWFISRNEVRKEFMSMEVAAVNLSSEHDPVAEILFADLSDAVQEDTVVKHMLFSQVFNYDEFYGYLKRKYFSGYWTKYDLQVTVCALMDSVLIEPDNIWHDCFGFFEGLLNEYGEQLYGSEFYYLNDANGHISYFTRFNFENGQDTVDVFTQLDSKLIIQELGYPELLLNQKQEAALAERHFSYAKYHQDRLITQAGEYPHTLDAGIYQLSEKEFSFAKLNGWNHIIYKPGPDNTIIVSNEATRGFDYLISLAYLFGSFFILFNFLLVIFRPSMILSGIDNSFRSRIQISFLSLLILSLIIVGAGTIFFSIQQYQSRHNQILGEKIQSVLIELVHKLEFEEELTAEWSAPGYSNLSELLKKFSNVFYTDINMYDTEGRLLATSRDEIFSQGLIGTHMNAIAYRKLLLEKRSEYIQKERIGNLEYISAYVPFINNRNQLLAYLNLPYFTRQSVWSNELSSLVVTILNIYVFLILISVGVAVFLSDKITRPLRLIQEKFAKIQLDEKKYEKIFYPKNDEIAGLVNEYNRMVGELENSLELLARTERETAWREMAKQIAHEIKNPLTPMKLNVQHLQRTYQDNPENWEEHLNKVSKSLIEQIDNLSSIATAFSNFAKMPRAKSEVLNIAEIVENSISLYQNNARITFNFIVMGFENKAPLVNADREQLGRVFINLITNSIQSVPPEENPLIEIRVSKQNELVCIDVVDNGKGISDELKDKLFEPNFTTKSGGMGLGLAITRNIVHQFNGEIKFYANEKAGTTFKVCLPLIG